MQTAVPWVFFDVGNTLISEEEAVAGRIRQLAHTFAACGIPSAESTIMVGDRIDNDISG